MDIKYKTYWRKTGLKGKWGDIYINGTHHTSGEYHFTANTWYHIVCTVDDAGMSHQNWNQGIRFGSRSDGSSGGNGGRFDHIRLFNRSITSSEATTLSNEF